MALNSLSPTAKTILMRLQLSNEPITIVFTGDTLDAYRYFLDGEHVTQAWWELRHLGVLADFSLTKINYLKLRDKNDG